MGTVARATIRGADRCESRAEVIGMQRRIREEKPKPRRRRRQDEDAELTPIARLVAPQRSTPAVELLDRLHLESESIERLLRA